jgi:ATP-binding cassette subfamily B protein
MKKAIKEKQTGAKKQPGMFSLLKPYTGMLALMVVLALCGNGINLVVPRIISHGIDSFTHGHYVMKTVAWQFGIAALFIFVFTYLQSIVQTYASEKVARDMRTQLSAKISRQSYAYIETAHPSKLLTNLTSDIDAIKMFVAQAIVSIASSIFLIIGASVLLLTINWKLALAVLGIIPVIGVTFFMVISKVKPFFKKSREIIDRLNRVINESIMGATLIRVINSQMLEYDKFLAANTEARNLGLSILRLFALLIPVITFTANMGMLVVLALGGHFVINGSMSLGELAAFNSYLVILIFPVLVIGFMSNVIAQASASYQRIREVLHAPDTELPGTVREPLNGQLSLQNISLYYGEKAALKNISFDVAAGSRTAVIGPTAAGKTQLLYLLAALTRATEGRITYDGHPIEDYDKELLHSQVGLVFQDSILFNMSIRENIAFSDKVSDEALDKAIRAAELKEFVESLPQKLDTLVSERGTSLSGGQKQRLMLARALAANPVVLLLDDFTARVDANTEQRILKNIRTYYPGLTLLSVTQKIASVEHYEQIILLMEGEILAKGTHDTLMQTCPEYVQIYQSQRSTSHYEAVQEQDLV